MQGISERSTVRTAAWLAALGASLFVTVTTSTWAGSGKCSGRESDPDCVLYLITRKCLDTSAAEYCDACPYPRSGYCPATSTCESTTELWTGTAHYVAIRDNTACACPQVIHGLVIPTGAITGVEDPDRPASIWKFAWAVAEAAGLGDQDAVLIVNPPEHRTQNQLHIHVLPLDLSKRTALEATPKIDIPDLAAVWTKADGLAAESGLASYGIVVHRSGAAWHLHVANAGLTDAYSRLPECSRPVRKR
ncbi:MAG: CDP-diacylglycerol diphosphatase [Acidobacteria bacterium]|nr:CDP-diacylglycerol diphosphatase [Acidobacteriota bacterium]